MPDKNFDDLIVDEGRMSPACRSPNLPEEIRKECYRAAVKLFPNGGQYDIAPSWCRDGNFTICSLYVNGRISLGATKRNPEGDDIDIKMAYIISMWRAMKNMSLLLRELPNG